jgi:hypothetical protein
MKMKLKRGKQRFSGKILHCLAGLLIVLVLAGSFYSCGNDDTPNIDFSNIEDLYKQPLSVIQKCIQGKWKVDVEYVKGTKSIIYHENTFIEFTEDKYIFDDGLKVDTINYFWEKEYDQIADFTTYVMRDKNTNNFMGYFGSIKNDTLDYNRFDFPSYPGAVFFVDPDYGYILVKVK